MSQFFIDIEKYDQKDRFIDGQIERQIYLTGLIYLSNQGIGLNGYQQYINQTGQGRAFRSNQESIIKLSNPFIINFIPIMFFKQRYIADFISGMKNYKHLGFVK